MAGFDREGTKGNADKEGQKGKSSCKYTSSDELSGAGGGARQEQGEWRAQVRLRVRDDGDWVR